MTEHYDDFSPLRSKSRDSNFLGSMILIEAVESELRSTISQILCVLALLFVALAFAVHTTWVSWVVLAGIVVIIAVLASEASLVVQKKERQLILAERAKASIQQSYLMISSTQTPENLEYQEHLRMLLTLWEIQRFHSSGFFWRRVTRMFSRG